MGRYLTNAYLLSKTPNRLDELLQGKSYISVISVSYLPGDELPPASYLLFDLRGKSTETDSAPVIDCNNSLLRLLGPSQPSSPSHPNSTGSAVPFPQPSLQPEHAFPHRTHPAARTRYTHIDEGHRSVEAQVGRNRIQKGPWNAALRPCQSTSDQAAASGG